MINSSKEADVLLKQLACPLLLICRKAELWIIGKEQGQKLYHCYPDLTKYFLQAGHRLHGEVSCYAFNFTTYLKENVLQ
ncbi:hypothetical protein IQ264_16810 [Phormidium sp. LEGE 05292]|uniref:hypothetical protein n=1 Tax=[Phormidium] sp. LEGE 05292 TaxID=767427 RepID=UPI00188199C9|nr:hypothetical protein [Phormidium sp. LEGE 05292]MBE9227091.1 hypothetical protein [Phormidium sp. LEGE 05292]